LLPPLLIRASGSDIFLLSPVLFKLLASKSAVFALRIPAELAPRLGLLLGLGMAKIFES
jgi:hypothetical protein